jgi:hypothetical protein
LPPAQRAPLEKSDEILNRLAHSLVPSLVMTFTRFMRIANINALRRWSPHSWSPSPYITSQTRTPATPGADGTAMLITPGVP